MPGTLKMPGRRLAIVGIVIALAAAAGAGVAGGYLMRQGDVDALDDQVRAEQARFAAAQRELAARQSRINALTKDQATVVSQLNTLKTQVDRLQQQVDAKTVEIASLQREVRSLNVQAKGLGEEALGKLRNQLEADRLLLVELRKDTPVTQADATTMWENVRRLAARSDPSLVAKAERVSRAVPAYYTWRESNFTSTQEAAIAFLLTGANQFEDASDNFWKSFLAILIDRLDTVADLSG